MTSRLEVKPAERLAWTVEEFATLTGASVLSVERAIEAGKLAHIKLGPRTLVPAAAAKSFVEGGAA